MDRFREPVSGFTHLLGALLAVTGLWYLVTLTWHNPSQLLTYVIFGGSMVFVYSSSTALHLRSVDCSERRFVWLNRIDHAAIYTLIAGTYTPVIYHTLPAESRWWVLGSIWGLAVVGIVYKLLFLIPDQDGIFSTGYYVVMALWGFIFTGPMLIQLIPPTVFWLLAGGGLVYLVGAGVFALQWPNLHRHFNFHDLWHLFVMTGSALHFIAMAMFIV